MPKTPLACLLLFALSGCTNIRQNEQPSLIAVTYGGVQNPFQKDRAGTGAVFRESTTVGTTPPFTPYPPATVRDCNPEMTACAVGVVVLKSKIALKSIGAHSATALVSVSYQLDGQQVLRDNNTTTTIAVSPQVPVLTDSDQFERVVTLPFGAKRRVSFAHGINFDVCIAPADSYMQTLDGQCSFDDIARSQVPQESIQAL